ncbi:MULTISPECIES: mechanosensitive ion channel family protein [Peptoniphilus]|uniref:mechanosensitive ion channel family protein n=1 Tax=Peptoniphilus TaxID=162289 RepID=UPI00028A0A79|nr:MULTISPECIES: mechanosensitive ion channel family protein [Peptoniphilus]MDU1954438.1 mechanosensitive ion channel family protein [Peptoniphilus lacydonensis]MDU2115167.1 mechanosensitive ion channel family protein [Peptoniphilus lacydonensis]MDU5274902.1 mechanosensitive ion channel family protein [Peptoniphilus lacydonensis]MDU5378098.1 mechanosensitive ion channel family protein [Peptoniphilus lacydonensis]MDU5437248.1 mechanosensitive ion channel family protein [Peptoniphilus lacydonens
MNLNKNTNHVANEADKALRSTFKGMGSWQKIFIVIIIIVGICVLLKIIDGCIDRQLSSEKVKEKGSYNRIVTITNLIKRIIKIILIFIGVTIIMSVFNISIAPILATLGVFSLAIGVGAQNLVKDVINGFFIILEDQYSVGDLVEIEGIEGVVEYLGLRVTKVRDFSKILHIIPNSNISVVSNKQRANIRTKIEFYVDNSCDPTFVKEKIDESLKKFKNDRKMVIGPDLWGVTENDKDAYKMSLVYYTKQGNQYDLEYAIRAEILKTMQRENIKTPVVKNKILKVEDSDALL